MSNKERHIAYQQSLFANKKCSMSNMENRISNWKDRISYQQRFFADQVRRKSN
jgi:hypothetical protein